MLFVVFCSNLNYKFYETQRQLIDYFISVYA